MPPTQPPAPPHDCKAVGCQRPVAKGKLMCIDHWRLVPVARQRDVWTCWREVNRRGVTLEQIQRYRSAVQAAIDAVHAKQLAKKATRDEGTPDLF